MKTRKVATDEAFINEAKTLLVLPQDARGVALDMLTRLRSSLELMEFMGFADGPTAKLTPEQIAAQLSMDAQGAQTSQAREAEAALAEMTLLLVGPGKTLSAADLVAMVRTLATSARAAYKSGGNGTPWSAKLSDEAFTPRALGEAENELGTSLKGLAENAVAMGIQAEISCKEHSDGTFTLGGGLCRSERVKAKLAAYAQAEAKKSEAEVM